MSLAFESSAFEGTAHRFLLRVAMELARAGRARRFDVAPDVWQALVYETSYASIPGCRMAEEIELRTCTGWVEVRCNAKMADNHGIALIGDGEDLRQAPLDFTGVL